MHVSNVLLLFMLIQFQFCSKGCIYAGCIHLIILVPFLSSKVDRFTFFRLKQHSFQAQRFHCISSNFRPTTTPEKILLLIEQFTLQLKSHQKRQAFAWSCFSQSISCDMLETDFYNSIIYEVKSREVSGMAPSLVIPLLNS